MFILLFVEGWKKPEVTPTLAHGFQDEFPSLTEQEKLSAKEKEELGKRHHQEGIVCMIKYILYLKSGSFWRVKHLAIKLPNSSKVSIITSYMVCVMVSLTKHPKATFAQ